MVLEQLDSLYGEKKWMVLCLIWYTTINLKWAIELNINSKIFKLLKENIGENIYNLKIGKNFVDRPKNYNILDIIKI